MCHLKGYRIDRRNDQIARRNYPLGRHGGRRLGEIKGAVFTPARPDAPPAVTDSPKGSGISPAARSHYGWDNRKLFTPQDKFKGSVLINKSVETDNCTQCHREMDGQKSGTLYMPAGDLHLKAGLRCTDCHTLAGKTQTERLRHQIGKGWSPTATARNDLDGAGMKTCAAATSRASTSRPGQGCRKKRRTPTTSTVSLPQGDVPLLPASLLDLPRTGAEDPQRLSRGSQHGTARVVLDGQDRPDHPRG